MPDELFRTVVVRRPAAHRFGAVPLSVAVHAAVIVVAVIVPLIATDVLPAVSIPLVLRQAPMPAVVVPDVRIPPRGRPPAIAVPTDLPGTPLVAPAGITNNNIAMPEIPQIRTIDPGAITGVQANVELEAPPPTAPRETKPTAPLPVGGKVSAPRRIRSEPPVYPQFAITARVQGVVVIEAIISTTGAVQQARVITSVPLLDEAALAAVRQWIFTPTLLNGVPVPVIMTVNVEFKLR